MNIIFTVFIMFLQVFLSAAQTKLKPGFDANECAEMYEILSRQADTAGVIVTLPYPFGYRMLYRSDSAGLDNRWDLWIRDDSVGVISIRGTTLSSASWLEDFYAAMVPAAGTLTLGKNNKFTYYLGNDTNAYVHTGFLLGLAYLAPSITKKINEYYLQGVKDYIIVGHSQGGAIAYLLTSYFYYLPIGVIPGDTKFKTYCSAPPKPGNIYYAYDFEFITRGGWAFRIVNVLDWVPQMPFSIQTEFDLNKNNPIPVVDSTIIENTNYFERVVVGYLQNSILGETDDARDMFIKYLGKGMFGFIKKYLPGLKEPKYVSSMYYMTAGTPIILMPTPEYYDLFPKQPGIKGLFTHHLFGPYYYLLKKEYLEK